jgi:hypothetical protein
MREADLGISVYRWQGIAATPRRWLSGELEVAPVSGDISGLLKVRTGIGPASEVSVAEPVPPPVHKP